MGCTPAAKVRFQADQQMRDGDRSKVNHRDAGVLALSQLSRRMSRPSRSSSSRVSALAPGNTAKMSIPYKKTNTRLLPYLGQKEVQALLDVPDPATSEGIRDRA